MGKDAEGRADLPHISRFDSFFLRGKGLQIHNEHPYLSLSCWQLLSMSWQSFLFSMKLYKCHCLRPLVGKGWTRQQQENVVIVTQIFIIFTVSRESLGTEKCCLKAKPLGRRSANVTERDTSRYILMFKLHHSISNYSSIFWCLGS